MYADFVCAPLFTFFFFLTFCLNIVHKWWWFASTLYTNGEVLPQYCILVLRFCLNIVNRWWRFTSSSVLDWAATFHWAKTDRRLCYTFGRSASILYTSTEVWPQYCTQVLKCCFNIVHKCWSFASVWYWGFASILYTSTEVLPQYGTEVLLQYCTQVLKFCLNIAVSYTHLRAHETA